MCVFCIARALCCDSHQQAGERDPLEEHVVLEVDVPERDAAQRAHLLAAVRCKARDAAQRAHLLWQYVDSTHLAHSTVQHSSSLSLSAQARAISVLFFTLNRARVGEERRPRAA